jgi:hypothetical protein
MHKENLLQLIVLFVAKEEDLGGVPAVIDRTGTGHFHDDCQHKDRAARYHSSGISRAQEM